VTVDVSTLRAGDVVRNIPGFENPVLIRDQPGERIVSIALLDPEDDQLAFTGSMTADSIQDALGRGAFVEREGAILGR
jgi:hypothetical protein